MSGELEFLRQQLIAKDEMINFLKQQLLAAQSNQPVKQIEQPKSKKFDVNVYLNTTCKDAINFLDLFTDEYLLNPSKNKWIMNHGMTKGILKYIQYGYYPKTTEFFTDMFLKVLNTLEPCNRPIFCNNKKDNKYYYKNEGKWEEISGIELGAKIFNKMTTIMFKVLYNTGQISEMRFNNIYKMNKNDWAYNYKQELSLIFYSIEKEPFTNYLLLKMKPICSIDKVAYVESSAHDWAEFKDTYAKDNNDSDSD